MIRKWPTAVRTVRLVGLTLVSISAFACGDGGGVRTGRAMETFRVTAAAGQDARVYALDVASRSDAPELGDYLLEAARERPYEIASAALRGLSERQVDGGAEALAPVFEEKRGALKVNAALALAAHGDAGAIDWLRQTLTDDRYRPGREVVVLLAEQGPTDDVQGYLAGEIASDDERRRDEAYLALGTIGTDWAKVMLLEGLGGERGARRKEAIVGIGLTEDPELADRIAKFSNTQGLVTATIEALGRLGGDASVAVARESLGHEESIVRIYAAEAMVRTGLAEEAGDVVNAIIHEGDVSDRQLLALRLGTVDADFARETLSRLVVDEDREVRLEAIRGLFAIADGGLSPVFVERVADEDYRVQAVAIEALGHHGSLEVVETTLEPLLESDNPYVRIAAAAAIVEIGARSAGS